MKSIKTKFNIRSYYFDFHRKLYKEFGENQNDVFFHVDENVYIKVKSIPMSIIIRSVGSLMMKIKRKMKY